MMQLITEQPPDITELVFGLGSRKAAFVEDEGKRVVYRRKYRTRLGEMEFFPTRGSADIESRFRSVLPNHVVDIEELVTDSHRREKAVTAPCSSMVEENIDMELPEVFDLRPLSSKRVTGKILRVEPARFYFIDDDEEGVLENIED